MKIATKQKIKLLEMEVKRLTDENKALKKETEKELVKKLKLYLAEYGERIKRLKQYSVELKSLSKEQRDVVQNMKKAFRKVR